ncbi:Uncharacterised protein [Klebsiella pneumoniae]|nr:Uncharacterised protein [Klebsiella pneumoniae]
MGMAEPFSWRGQTATASLRSLVNLPNEKIKIFPLDRFSVVNIGILTNIPNRI